MAAKLDMAWISSQLDAGPGAAVAEHFIQPTFARLRDQPAAADGECYVGLITLGEQAGRAWTLQGRVWRRDAHFYLLAEHDVEELHRINELVLALNRQSADAQHALAQASVTLRQREDEIRRMSLTDGLTAVGNRRALEQALAAGLARAAQQSAAFSLVTADPDGCKQVNERYGYRTGDVVLVAFGTLLRQRSRDTDFVARYGGKEFVVLLPGIDLSGAREVAERMRAAWEEVDIEPIREPLHASFGVAQHRAGESADVFLRRAEEALRSAKSSGRNRVTTAAAEANDRNA
jgi:diguanylate cyclase (GGDEF)-like protein